MVIPSLAGFGFSGAPRQPGFGIMQHAKTLDSLMLALGYPKYFAQG